MKKLKIAEKIQKELQPLWKIARFNGITDVPYTVQKAKIMSVLDNTTH